MIVIKFCFVLFCFWLHWVFIAVHGLSLVAASAGFSLRQLLLLWSTGSRHAGFSSCSTLAQQLWHVGPSMCGLQQLWCVGSVVVVCGLQGMQASVVVACRFSSCGSWALEHRLSSCGTRTQLLCGMWDLPRPGIEPVSPALAGGFLTTEPPGKSQ